MAGAVRLLHAARRAATLARHRTPTHLEPTVIVGEPANGFVLRRVAGLANERGNGDRCHLHGVERSYRFTVVDALVEDFIAAVDAARSKS